MQYQIELQLNNQPAALERVLQVTRYRQFNVETLQMQQLATDKLAISLQVTGQQSINLLTSQLNKLYDLTQMKVSQDMPLSISA
ncbi:MAG: acetolactate synthase 2 small subunit [Aestuariibacter sp.]